MPNREPHPITIALCGPWLETVEAMAQRLRLSRADVIRQIIHEYCSERAETLDALRPYYSIAQAAERLGVSAKTVRRLVADGSIRAIRIGRQWRIPERVIGRDSAERQRDVDRENHRHTRSAVARNDRRRDTAK
jgi:excisionase family DNA binding protein